MSDTWWQTLERADAATWRADQDALVQRSMDLAASTPSMVERLEQAGVEASEIASVDDLNRLPVLSKDDLPAMQAAHPPLGGLSPVPANQLRRLFLSPGPILDPEGEGPDYWRFAPALAAAGFSAEDIVYNTFSYHLSPAGAMMEEGLLALGCTVVPGGVGNTELQVDMLSRSGATGYVGTPDFLHTLKDSAKAQGRTLHLRRAFVSGGPLPERLRTLLESHGDLKVFQGYGTADAGNLGYECDARHGWHVAPGAVVEVVDPATGQALGDGEVGEVVVTVPSPVYPLIRFGTGDLSALDLTPCACGRTTPRLRGWQGRVGDGVKVRGMFVHARQLANVFAGLPEVTAYAAVVQHNDAGKDELVVQITGDADMDSEAIIDTLRATIKVRPTVQVVERESITKDTPPLVDERTWD